MKKAFAILLTLILALGCMSALGEQPAASEAVYTWEGMTFALTEVTEDIGEWKSQLKPADGKWAMAVFKITDGEMEVKALEERMVDQGSVLLSGAPARTLAAQGIRIGEDSKVYAVGSVNVFFDVPAELEVAQAEISVEAEDNGAPVTDSAVHITTASGAELMLTPIEAEAFAAQDDGVIVHTRVGTTVHNSGSQFLAGSGLGLGNMRNTRQYDMPRVTFTYESALDFDATADAIGEIGETAALTLNGALVPVQVAWITQDMACFIFDCGELPSGIPAFSVEEGALVITE